MNLDPIARGILSELCRSHPLGYAPRLAWKGYRVSAGMAHFTLGSIGLSYIVIRDEAQLRDTLTHEYAHLLAYKRHGKAGRGHGLYWHEAMRDLGAEPIVRHNYPVLRNARRQEVGYQCQKCGIMLIRPRRLPKKRRYLHAQCGGPIKYAWTREVTPAAPVA